MLIAYLLSRDLQLQNQYKTEGTRRYSSNLVTEAIMLVILCVIAMCYPIMGVQNLCVIVMYYPIMGVKIKIFSLSAFFRIFEIKKQRRIISLANKIKI